MTVKTAVQRRVEMEARVIRRLLRYLLQDGHAVSLFDSEEWSVKKSTDFTELADWIHATDEQILRWRDPAGELIGGFHIVYGNSAAEVIADHSANDRCEAAYRHAVAIAGA